MRAFHTKRLRLGCFPKASPTCLSHSRLPLSWTMTQNPLLFKAHTHIRNVLKPGDSAVDATAGNGHDALFLAECIQLGGKLWAVDIQAAAIEASRQRLASMEKLEGVTLIQANHADLFNLIPSVFHGKIRVIVFNLGYLPGGNKACITLPHSTLSALSASLSLLAPGGLLSVMVYPGHKGGAAEAQVILDWLTTLDKRYTYRIYTSKMLNTQEDALPSLEFSSSHLLPTERPYLRLSAKPFWICLSKGS